jgi:hypothetical protein
VEKARQQILSEHSETVTAVIETAERVATAIDDWPISDPKQIRLPLEQLLEERGLREPLLGVLKTCANALDAEIQGQPVASSPYLAVTSTGVVCRATLSGGGRLVIELVLFEAETRPPRYRFLAPTVHECLQIQIR